MRSGHKGGGGGSPRAPTRGNAEEHRRGTAIDEVPIHQGTTHIPIPPALVFDQRN